MALPQLIAKENTIVPAKPEEVIVIPGTPEKTFDKFWITQFSLIATSPQEDAKLIFRMVPARDIEIKGVPTKELIDDDSAAKTVVISNVFEKAATDVDFNNALVDALNELVEIGKDKGYLK